MRWQILLAVAVLLALPAATAQRPVDRCTEQCDPQAPDVNEPPMRSEGPVNEILYGHFLTHFGPAPMNLEPPHAFEEDLNAGWLLGSVSTRIGYGSDVNLGSPTFTLYPSAGAIRDVSEPGQPGTTWSTEGHGGAFVGPLELGPGPIVVYAYLSADADPSTNAGAGAAPRIEVEARWDWMVRVRNGELAPRTVAYGKVGPLSLVSIPFVAGTYEIPIQMEPELDFLPECRGGSRSCPMTVTVRQVETNRVDYVHRDLRLRSGPEYPWRVILPVENPLVEESFDAFRYGDQAVVMWSVLSPFGSYDVDEASLHFELRGADGRLVAEPSPVLVHKSTDHDGIRRPVELTWKIPLDDLPETGNLDALLSVDNLQGTYRLMHQAVIPVSTFVLDMEELPAPSGMVWVAYAGAAVLAWRRHFTTP